MDSDTLHEAFQPTQPQGMRLGDSEIHVWAAPLVGSGASFEATLSPQERRRAEQYRVIDHRRRYTIAHGVKRAILGGYAGVDPASLEFEGAGHDKPRLLGHDYSFNLAHSSKLVLIAVGRDEVGVDVEKTRYVENLLDMARENFSKQEYGAIQRCDEPDRLAAFYRCWTRKEAFVKALGTGSPALLRAFDVSLDEEPRFLAFREGAEERDWGVWDVSPGPGYVAAVAGGTPASQVVKLRFDVS
ncbi:MAG: 4'-phosphopantetheinyl transferase superfamily protein [Planctomycetota bacterium]|nr:4'-phosphopantetheinyl transferase superfamily protein [Planctomycetota bacterium]